MTRVRNRAGDADARLAIGLALSTYLGTTDEIARAVRGLMDRVEASRRVKKSLLASARYVRTCLRSDYATPRWSHTTLGHSKHRAVIALALEAMARGDVLVIRECLRFARFFWGDEEAVRAE